MSSKESLGLLLSPHLPDQAGGGPTKALQTPGVSAQDKGMSRMIPGHGH
jgi:hypothetical protein